MYRSLATLGVSIVFVVGPARAEQGNVELERFRPAHGVDGGLGLDGPPATTRARFGATIDLASRPLGTFSSASDKPLRALVSEQTVVHMGADFPLGSRLHLAFALPATVSIAGTPEPTLGLTPGSAGVGNARAGARGTLIELDRSSRIGMAAYAVLPSATGGPFAGGSAWGLEALGLARWQIGMVTTYVNFGGRTRPSVELANVRPRSECLLGAGLGAAATASTTLHTEFIAASPSPELPRSETYAEWLSGIRQGFAAFDIQGGAGIGLAHGYGTPAFRLFLGVALNLETQSPPLAASAPAPQPRPKSAEATGADATALDSDNDGLVDAMDACRLLPEDRDGIDDADGCPDPDAPSVGKAAAVSVANSTAVSAPSKAASSAAGQRHEASPQAEDATEPPPLTSLTPSAPAATPPELDFSRIHFDTDSDIIKSEYAPILDEAATYLKTHAEVAVVDIEGHTDDRGTSEHNALLSQRRAFRVVLELTRRGIAPGRLRAVGFAENHPLANTRTAIGRAVNRRVEVHPKQQ